MYQSSNGSSVGQFWWKTPEQDLHKEVFSYVQYLDNNQSYRSSDNLRNARLYGNYEMLGLDNYSYTRIETSYSVTHRVTLNVIQSMIDTVVSKITKNKPKPYVLTDGGDFSLQQRAKKLTKFLEGTFSSSEFYEQAVKAFTDSCIFGTGCIKIFEKEGNICAERVFIEEIKLDDVESFYAKPRQMHQVKYIHKDVLLGMFPNNHADITRAQTSEENYAVNQAGTKSDMIKVVESWHLPSSPKSDDGKHTISIATATLIDDSWDKDYFPFVFFRWGERPVGFFGQGLAEQLQGIQLEINKILRTIQVSMHLVSVPKLLVEASSKIVQAHLNNKIGGIIKYAGTPPQYASLGGIPPELFSHLDRLYQRAYEIAGVSQLSAQSQKPGGLNSGKALREFNHLESERFMTISKRYEEAFIKAAHIMVDLARDIYKDDPNLKVKAKGSKFLETIKWEDVDMEDDKFLMDIFPTSYLSHTPSGRLQDVQELLQAGFISKEDGMKLLDFPDLESVTSLYNAAVEDIEAVIEKMVEKGDYETPEPYQNLQLGIEKCQYAYLKYRRQGVEDDRLELLRRWIEDANALIEKANQPEEVMMQPALALQQQDPAALAQQLAAEGAEGAAREVAENANLGENV